MLNPQVRRLLDAYPAIFLACHRKHLRDESSGRTLSEHQAGVLDHLHADRPVTLSKLAEHMGVGCSSMSIMVRRLVGAGYVARRRNKADGRSVALTLTAAGARVKEQNTVLDPQLVNQMFGLMRPSELETSLRAVECLAKYAGILLRRRARR